MLQMLWGNKNFQIIVFVCFEIFIAYVIAIGGFNNPELMAILSAVFIFFGEKIVKSLKS